MVRQVNPDSDAPRLAQIYNHYVATDTATFEVDPVEPATMAARARSVQAAGLPYLVATDALGVVGFAYAAAFHERAAYRHTLTCSVYVDRAAHGTGVGRALYTELLRRIAAVHEGPHAPVRAVVALIALPNDASVALHESMGFVKSGHLEAVGQKFGRWIDVGYWQYMLPQG